MSDGPAERIAEQEVAVSAKGLSLSAFGPCSRAAARCSGRDAASLPPPCPISAAAPVSRLPWHMAVPSVFLSLA